MAQTFALDVSEFVRKAKSAPETVVRKVSLGLLSDIVYGTPVDTGRARASWGVGLNRIDAPVAVTVTDKDGHRTVQQGLAKLSEWKPGDDVFIFSRLPYVERIEFGGWNGPTQKVTAEGFSIQAPHGMVRIAVVRWHDHLRDAVRELPK